MQVKQGPRVSARLLADRVRSHGLATGLWAQSTYLILEEGGPVSGRVGYEVAWLSQSLCRSTSGQGQCPTGPRLGCSLLCSLGPRLLDCRFLPSDVCPLVGKASLEASAGFLMV